MTGLRALRWQLLLQYLMTVGLLLAVAEGALYGLVRWANERELDAVLNKEVRRLAAAVEYDKDKPKLDGKKSLERAQPDDYTTTWQVLQANGKTFAWSPKSMEVAEDLPAVGGARPQAEIVHIADAEYANVGTVRAARLLTVRQRQSKPAPLKSKAKKKEKEHEREREKEHEREREKEHERERGVPLSQSSSAPDELQFDIRVVVDRGRLDGQLRQLGGYLLLGFPAALLLAGAGGMLLIRRAVRPVERAFDRERRFTGAASHELRTPLTALRGEIEVTLRRERAPEEYTAALQRMEGLACRMTVWWRDCCCWRGHGRGTCCWVRRRCR